MSPARDGRAAKEEHPFRLSLSKDSSPARDGTVVKDLYTVVAAFFNPEMNSWALPAIGLYLLGQFALGFHLWHGFSSGFQSVGLRHPRFTPLLQGLGKAFSVVVPALFSAIVLFLYITQA